MTHCKALGCTAKARSKGLCNKHYIRCRTYGDWNHVPERDRLMAAKAAFIDAAAVHEDADGCLEWPYLLQAEGYGYHGRERVHRLVMEVKLGRKLRRDEFVCHTCDNPPCCNPHHLVVADAQWNARDRAAKMRSKQQEGATNDMAKLCDGDVLEIRRLYADGGHYMRELAAMFGVSRSTVSMIVNRKSWTHI